MKRQTMKVALLALMAAVFQGCVAFPPLVQVEHKESNPDIARRLDSIDRRLDELEKKLNQK
jgi:hypothetical protein